MLHKTTSTQQTVRASSDELDRLTHAMAFVILQRQMRGRWTSNPRPFKSAHA